MVEVTTTRQETGSNLEGGVLAVKKVELKYIYYFGRFFFYFCVFVDPDTHSSNSPDPDQ
jgi:hypothetical protein